MTVLANITNNHTIFSNNTFAAQISVYCIVGNFPHDLIFANFMVCEKFIHENKIMVHTLFWIDS